jgi:hypothetical protein
MHVCLSPAMPHQGDLTGFTWIQLRTIRDDVRDLIRFQMCYNCSESAIDYSRMLLVLCAHESEDYSPNRYLPATVGLARSCRRPEIDLVDMRPQSHPLCMSPESSDVSLVPADGLVCLLSRMHEFLSQCHIPQMILPLIRSGESGSVIDFRVFVPPKAPRTSAGRRPGTLVHAARSGLDALPVSTAPFRPRIRTTGRRDASDGEAGTPYGRLTK